MQERASRYAASAGSEEIELIVASKENDENRSNSDDNYSPPRNRRTTMEKTRECLSNESSRQYLGNNSYTNNKQTTGNTEQNSILFEELIISIWSQLIDEKYNE